MSAPKHEHDWREAYAFNEPAKACECGEWTQITKREFKDLFGRSFWRFKKEYDDTYLFGGYKGRLHERT